MHISANRAKNSPHMAHSMIKTALPANQDAIVGLAQCAADAPLPRPLRFDPFAGRADENELFQTRSKFGDRPEVLHGIAASGKY
jgi:hypothetical protein